MDKTRPRIGMRTLLLVLTTLIFVIPAAITGVVYTDKMRTSIEEIVLTRLKERGELSSEQLARRLYRLWLEVYNLSQTVLPENPDQLRPQFEAIVRADNRYSWIGVATVNGQIAAAAGPGREDANVSKREWFRRGLQQFHAGEHVAPTAAMAHAGSRSGHFVEFAAPIVSTTGEILGVIGAHFDWAWLRDVLESFGTPQIEVLLLSRDRRVLFGPPGLEGQQLQLGSALAAAQGSGLPRIEQWPDGVRYLTYIMPRLEHRSLPSFGWSLIIRQKTGDAFASARFLFQSFWLTATLGAVAALAGFYIFTFWLTRPLARMCRFAGLLAQGKDPGVPPEESGYREAAALSAALARLQSRLKSSGPQLSLVGADPGSSSRDASAG